MQDHALFKLICLFLISKCSTACLTYCRGAFLKFEPTELRIDQVYFLLSSQYVQLNHKRQHVKLKDTWDCIRFRNLYDLAQICALFAFLHWTCSFVKSEQQQSRFQTSNLTLDHLKMIEGKEISETKDVI